MLGINGNIDALHTQQQEVAEAMEAISILLKEPLKNFSNSKHQKISGVKRKAKYHHISCRNFAIAMLTEHPEGLTVMQMAEEMALPTKGALKTCYGSIDGAVRGWCKDKGGYDFGQKGDKWFLEKLKSPDFAKAEPILVSEPIPIPKRSQPDMFDGLGDFLKKQEEKHYPSKAIAKERVA